MEQLLTVRANYVYNTWEWLTSCGHKFEAPDLYVPDKCSVCGEQINKARALISIGSMLNWSDLKTLCERTYMGVE